MTGQMAAADLRRRAIASLRKQIPGSDVWAASEVCKRVDLSGNKKYSVEITVDYGFFRVEDLCGDDGLEWTVDFHDGDVSLVAWAKPHSFSRFSRWFRRLGYSLLFSSVVLFGMQSS